MSRVQIAFLITLIVLFFGGIFYLRYAGVSGSPQTYLYLEVGGTLISFCYAANALVRFRGTHDRTALILAFGFVLSGIIETVGYFSLNALMQAGHAAHQRSDGLDGQPHAPRGDVAGRDSCRTVYADGAAA